ncbi:MAG: gamma-glutamyltransferase family protein [Thermoprotei archaeon]
MPGFTVYGKNGVVVSQNYHASMAGIKILENGGNAFDAAITISSVLSVVIPHTGGLGGDGFILAITPDGIIGYNGSGPAPSGFDEKEYISIAPVRGPLTVTIPGLVDLWRWVYDKYCTKNLEELLSQAISLAVNGFPVSDELARAIEASKNILASYQSWNKLYGNFKSGDWFIQKDLGEVLKKISKFGPEEFYKGELARELADGLRAQDVPVDIRDLRVYKGEPVRPLRSEYRGYDIYELPPNTQGITTLEILSMIEEANIDRLDFNDPQRIELQLKITGLAYEDRDAFLGDPRFSQIPIEKLLSKNYLRNRIQEKLKGGILKGADTTFFAVADKFGNMVGFIQSLFYPFGSGIVVKGIPFQNRGAGFAKSLSSPNRPGRGRRPLHTLSVLLAEKGERKLIIGCAGGDLRPQIHSEILENIVAYNMNISKAVDAPRFMLTEWNKYFSAIIEGRLQLPKSNEIKIETLPYYSSSVGIANIIEYVRGVYAGTSDPRSEGIALAL